MEVSIKEISICLDLNVLATKEYLIKKRKEGVIFLKDSLSDLRVDTRFHLYYFMMPSKSSQIDAFPVPTKIYKSYQDKLENYIFLYQFFKRYYQIERNDLSFFEQYNLVAPFIGIKYLWFYKNTILRGDLSGKSI